MASEQRIHEFFKIWSWNAFGIKTKKKYPLYPVKSDCLKSFEEVVSIDELYIEIIALDAL